MKKALAGILAALLITGAAAAVLIVREKQTDKSPVFTEPTISNAGASSSTSDNFFVQGADVDWISDESTPIIEPQGSTFVMKSWHREQGETEPAGHPLALGFTGELNITVNHSEIFDSPESAGISWADISCDSDYVNKHMTDPCFLLIELTMENVNAVADGGVPSEQYLWNASMFRLIDQDTFTPPNNTNRDYDSAADENVLGGLYFNLHSDSEKGYRNFTLEPGETASIQLGYFVERSYAEKQNLYLKFGYIGEHLLGVALQPAESR